MKKNVIILCLIAISSLVYSQVGVGTSNPQGALHIDGAKDNLATGTPTVVQQANDFIVTSTGDVGVGTIAPAAKLDVDGNVKITDGTQGANKVLMSDANGVSSWSNIPGSWLGLLRGGSVAAAVTTINFTSGKLIGQGGAVNVATDTITVPSTGLYEITIGGFTNHTTTPYLTGWEVRSNGVMLDRIYYGSPTSVWGTVATSTIYEDLNANDNLTLVLTNVGGGGGMATSCSGTFLAVKLVE